METIRDKEFGGERPLFGTRGLHLENVTFHAGESALKCCADIEAEKCRFEGKYPFWHTDGFKVRNSLFTPGARAALWYSRNLEMTDTQVDAPKMFREIDGIVLRNVNIPDAEETLWHCANVDIRDVKVANADYLFMHSHDIRIKNWHQQGNYSFQYCRNVEIRNAEIHSKDAFWGTEDCVFEEDCDLAFEDSEVNAILLSPVTSVKNPMRGSITAETIKEIIIDGFSKAVEPVKIISTNAI